MEQHKKEAISFNCGDDFGHGADWYVTARPA